MRGSTYIKNSTHLLEKVNSYLEEKETGVFLRPTIFQPTSGKWQGEDCRGIQLHILEPRKIKSYSLALALLKSFMDMGEDSFAWKQPPYEYNYDTLPIKLILGSENILDNFKNFSLEDSFWEQGVEQYREQARSFYLYS